MSMDGMNVEAVREIARGLKVQATTLRAVLKRVDSLVNNIENEWKGPDAQQFCSWWRTQCRPMLVQLIDRLDGLGQSAANNADEQDRASGSAPSSGMGPSGGGSGGGGHAGGGGGGGGEGFWGDEPIGPIDPMNPSRWLAPDDPFPNGIDPGFQVMPEPVAPLPRFEPDQPLPVFEEGVPKIDLPRIEVNLNPPTIHQAL
jgi:WXG100 family type VII secretion target